jgi:hypothetical protein
MRAPLLGHNLVRLLYLDEAGISAHESALCVAGVLIHGDTEAFAVEKKLAELVQRYIPEEDRRGFIFHATDVFHGSRYFDRKKWPQDIRIQILNDLAGIIDSLSLPVVWSVYQKDTFGRDVPEVFEAAHNQKRVIMQAASVVDCATWADRWLEKFAPEENAIIIAEDTDRVKRMLKASISMLRNPDSLKSAGLDWIEQLPLKRIVDTVLFAAKEDCAALQLADLCAFTVGRGFKDKPVPMEAFRILYRHFRWVRHFRPDFNLPENIEDLIESASSAEQSS